MGSVRGYVVNLSTPTIQRNEWFVNLCNHRDYLIMKHLLILFSILLLSSPLFVLPQYRVNRGLSWFTRNTKNWHIVYNWLPYSKPIERDALCPDVHVADFQTFKKQKQSCHTSRMEFQHNRYMRIWEYIQINFLNCRNKTF